jgi:hypothetical protein
MRRQDVRVTGPYLQISPMVTAGNSLKKSCVVGRTPMTTRTTEIIRQQDALDTWRKWDLEISGAVPW